MRLKSNAQKSLFDVPREQVIVDEVALWDNLKSRIAQLPQEDEEVLPGLKWGTCYQLYTPAFWKLQYLMNEFPETTDAHQLGGSLVEEVVQCILGGYGIPSEMGILAFARLKDRDLIRKGTPFEAIYEALRQPFLTERSTLAHYRFSHQKSRYIHDFLSRKDLGEIPEHNDLELRDWLIGLKGIGPKTASWITRNWLRSERVAILDIHLLRAGVITGFFEKELDVVNHYYLLETSYLSFCQHLQVRPSDMDAIIWSYMKKNNKLALSILSLT